MVGVRKMGSTEIDWVVWKKRAKTFLINSILWAGQGFLHNTQLLKDKGFSALPDPFWAVSLHCSLLCR